MHPDGLSSNSVSRTYTGTGVVALSIATQYFRERNPFNSRVRAAAGGDTDRPEL
ncbi:hypothetical protein EXIGLDRAFT_722757, partial [Exidia glandulosa HHB12029]